MASTDETPPEAGAVRVRSVRVRNGRLRWTTADGTEGEASADDVVATLPASAAQARVVCCLAEDEDEDAEAACAAGPFRLLLLLLPAAAAADEAEPGTPPQLRRRVDVVVSVGSGRGLALAFWRAVLRPLLALARRAWGVAPPCVVVTEDAGSVRRYARSLRRRAAAATVVLLGGDGGVADLLNGHGAAPGPPPPPLLALLPLGTANALFHSLHRPVAPGPGGPSPLVLALRTLFGGAPADLPVFRASFSPGARAVPDGPAAAAPVSSLLGAVVASFGFHASVVYESDTPEYRAHGDRRFAIVAQRLLREAHPYAATLSVRASPSGPAERDARQTHAYVLVSLVSHLERAFAISPASRPLDGKLRLVHFGPVGGERTMEVMTRAYDGGSHVGMRWGDGEAVRYQEVDEVVVEALDDDARWRKFCVDGTIVEVPPGGTMTVSMTQERPFRILVDSRVQRGDGGVQHGGP